MAKGEVFNGEPKNYEAMAKELLGDDDLFYIYQRAIDTYDKEMIARMHNMSVDQVKRGVYRRTKNDAVLIDDDIGEQVCREDSARSDSKESKTADKPLVKRLFTACSESLEFRLYPSCFDTPHRYRIGNITLCLLE